MTREIRMGDIPVPMRATAALPLLYRAETGRDILRDLEALKDTGVSSGILEDLAYVMAKHADPSIPEKLDWLAQFPPLAVYEAAEELIGLWMDNTATTEQPKKK